MILTPAAVISSISVVRTALSKVRKNYQAPVRRTAVAKSCSPHLIVANGQGDVGAEAVEDASQLHRDVTGTNHQHLPEG